MAAGAIVRRGNRPQGQLSAGAIVPGAIVRRGNCPTLGKFSLEVKVEYVTFKYTG